MKIIILMLYFGAAFAYNENVPTSENFFQPAQPGFDTLGLYEQMPFRRKNEVVFFQPDSPGLGGSKHYLGEQVQNSQRFKREAGALHIVTNHAQAIHADVKADGTSFDATEKVTPPDDAFYELKSLRKSWPLPNKLELARSINRIITLAVLVTSAIIEFFPLLKGLYYVVYTFMYL